MAKKPGGLRAVTRRPRPMAGDEAARLPATRDELLDRHTAARRKRNAAPLGSEEHGAAVDEIGRIEVRIAAIERAMAPPKGLIRPVPDGRSRPDLRGRAARRPAERGDAVPTATKRRYIELLAAAGLREIEATSFVSPAAIPQLADADELLPAFRVRAGVRYPVLVPIARGLARAEAAGADAIAVFTAASDAFTTRNIGMTIAASLEAFAPVLARAA